MHLASGYFWRGGDRIKPRLQRMERRDQLGERGPRRSEVFEQVEEVWIFRAGAGVAFGHRLQQPRLVDVVSA
jgi:hypothetical protein